MFGASAGKKALAKLGFKANKRYIEPLRINQPGRLKRSFQTAAKWMRRGWITAKWATAVAAVGMAGLYFSNPEEVKDFSNHHLTKAFPNFKGFGVKEPVYRYPHHPNPSLMAMTVPRYVEEHLQNAHESTDVEYPLLRLMGAQESAFNATVKNPRSNACGLMQLIPSTQLALMYNYGSKYGYEQLSRQIRNDGGVYKVSGSATTRTNVLEICKDALFSARMGAEYARENIDRLHNDFPRRLVNYTDVYMYHFLGPGGGKAFIQALETTPGRIAKSDFSDAVVSANYDVFHKSGSKPRSYAEIYELFAQRLGTKLIEPDLKKQQTYYTIPAFIERLSNS